MSRRRTPPPHTIVGATVEELLLARLDESIAAEQNMVLTAHLATCASCLGIWTGLLRAQGLLLERPHEQALADAERASLARLRAAMLPSPQRQSKLRRRVAPFAAAAMVLIGILAGRATLMPVKDTAIPAAASIAGVLARIQIALEPQMSHRGAQTPLAVVVTITFMPESTAGVAKLMTRGHDGQLMILATRAIVSGLPEFVFREELQEDALDTVRDNGVWLRLELGENIIESMPTGAGR